MMTQILYRKKTWRGR